jgi:hypothetical protein
VGERVGTSAALLQALFEGPADSGALAGRLARRGLRRVEIGSAEIARGLRELLRGGMLRTWRRASRGASGTRTAFYELTSAGVAEATRAAASGARPGRARAGSKAVDRRLKRSLDISAVAEALGRRGARSASRR